jgi:PPOX class probable F420-dependent enzyme
VSDSGRGIRSGALDAKPALSPGMMQPGRVIADALAVSAEVGATSAGDLQNEEEQTHVMDNHDARRRFAAARVAHLGTVRPDGTPHLVPVTFAVDDDVIYTAVDAKPNRTTRLQRLENLAAHPRCTLLVDHYDDDWSRLWWVRADGDAAVVDSPDPAHPAFALLAARYPAYADTLPHGPLIVISVTRWVGWSAA